MKGTLLAVDVGGTKCELAIFPLAEIGGSPLVRKRYVCSEYPRFEDIVAAFLAECGIAPSHATIDVAGVVSGGVAKFTNLDWVIAEPSLAREFDLEAVHLINDMTAVCASLPLLSADDVLEIQRGEEQRGQLIGVVAPGTGLGEGLLVQTDGFFFPRGSEGGHTDFGPVDQEQSELLRWMLTRQERVSYENLIAGPGIANLYMFYHDCLGFAELPAVEEELKTVSDTTPVIFAHAFGACPSPLCRKVVELFLDILGAEAGNLALKLYARGGIYVGGGIIPRIVDRADFSGFLRHFRAKSQMRELMESIPVKLIRRSDAALLGAARYGMELFSGK
ncbi:MAG: glucokinase [Desulfopila sp.]